MATLEVAAPSALLPAEATLLAAVEPDKSPNNKLAAPERLLSREFVPVDVVPAEVVLPDNSLPKNELAAPVRPFSNEPRSEVVVVLAVGSCTAGTGKGSAAILTGQLRQKITQNANTAVLIFKLRLFNVAPKF